MTATLIPETETVEVTGGATAGERRTAHPDDALRVTQRSVTKAEWIKFRSVRSNVIGAVAAGLLMIGFGTLFSSLAGSEQSFGPEAASGTDSLSMSFAGIDLSLLVLGVLGAVFVAGEYSNGLIRTMFTAVARRGQLLRAKALVVAAASFVVMAASSFVVFVTGRAAYAGDGVVYGLGDDGVVRALLGGGVMGAGIALMGLALGFILRSTAAAIGTLVAVVMIAPGLVPLLPGSLGDTIAKFLPSNAGQAFLNVAPTDTLLSPGAGFAVFATWVVGLMGVALVVLRRRDA